LLHADNLTIKRHAAKWMMKNVPRDLGRGQAQNDSELGARDKRVCGQVATVALQIKKRSWKTAAHFLGHY
jgi:hypothetical protein